MSFHYDEAPFRRRLGRARLHPGLCFQGDLSSEDNRLEIGESAVLARIVRTRAGVRLEFPGGQERAKARLAAAYMQPVSDQAMDALTGAARASVTGLPEGWAMYLNGVYFDGCRESNGVMLEAKANYAFLLDKQGNWLPWVDQKTKDDLDDQMKRASDAAGVRGVEYHAQQESMVLRLRAIATRLERPNVTVIWNPRGDRAY